MEKERPHLLLTNDDGINGEGLHKLRKALGDFRISIVVPDRERSAASHALTLHHPIRVHPVRNKEDFYTTDGTPADCVNLGVNGILKKPPDLIVSGINGSPNLGDDITYSGTVSAAMEGIILDVPSFAISMADKEPDLRYETGAWVAKGGLPSLS